MFISIWSSDAWIPATSVTGCSECCATASRLLDIRCICQMPTRPTTKASAIATPKAPKIRVETLRSRIAASRRGSRRVGGRMWGLSTQADGSLSEGARVAEKPCAAAYSAVVSVDVPVRDRQTAIPPERLRRDLDAGRGLPPLVLRVVDHGRHARHEVGRPDPGGHDGVDPQVVLDVGLDDRVELFIGRQRV